MSRNIDDWIDSHGSWELLRESLMSVFEEWGIDEPETLLKACLVLFRQAHLDVVEE